MTDLRQAAQQALDAWGDPMGMKDLCVAMDALRTALEQPEQGPTCPECKAAVLYECVACSSNNYPPAAKWDKPSASFNDWWDSYHIDPANPFAEGSAAYWAWAGWKAAQRPWVGLTDEDVNKESAMIASKMKLAFHAGMYVAQQVLKERNT